MIPSDGFSVRFMLSSDRPRVPHDRRHSARKKSASASLSTPGPPPCTPRWLESAPPRRRSRHCRSWGCHRCYQLSEASSVLGGTAARTAVQSSAVAHGTTPPRPQIVPQTAFETPVAPASATHWP
jgi:hypothetical protein